MPSEIKKAFTKKKERKIWKKEDNILLNIELNGGGTPLHSLSLYIT